ncbi:MAG: RNA methyltransferase [bacterium]
MADLFLALLHHPVLDKNGQIVTSAVTQMDIHDIARTATTYGVRAFYVVTPIRALRALSEKILEHWETGYGSTYNLTRKEALQLVRLETDLDGTLVAIERETGQQPTIVVTSARSGPDRIDYASLRGRLGRETTPHLLVFGTGWGLAPEVMQRADLCLGPIHGPTPYNHLSVRSAAAVILDRLRGTR